MIAETFDTHIKAISTEQEWERYKAMIMSNAEEMLQSNELFKARKEEFELADDDKDMPLTYYMSEEDVVDMMQAHTNQALQELKERVGSQDGFVDPESDVELVAKDHVISMIEDMQDE